MQASVRRRVVIVAIVTLIGGFSLVGWRSWRVLRYRGALTEIQGEIDEKRYAIAARELARVLSWEPGSDEATYLLGLCDKELGRTESALERWTSIPSGSPYSARAILGRATLEVDRGRFAAAEALIEQSLSDARVEGFDLRRFLAPLFWHEGRLAEARKLVEINWEALEKDGRGGSGLALELVRLHLLLSMGTSSREAVARFLERAGRLAPDDDRVWLGKANLAVRDHAFDEAARWLASCLERRPRDVPVWRARLDYAVASGQVDLARECLGHLPGGAFTRGEVYKLGAWLAVNGGDLAAEEHALNLLRVADPGDSSALERLAELAERRDETDRAQELRFRVKELEQTKSRYKELFLRDQASRDAKEMAELAQRLGREFEATVFWSAAIAAEPDRADLRRKRDASRRRETSTAEAGQTLAELIDSRLENDLPASTP